MTYDGLHFTTRGASLFADALYPWLIEVASQHAADAKGTWGGRQVGRYAILELYS
jgi:hypothetical protein